MRRKSWSAGILGLFALAGVLAAGATASRAEMCTPAIKDCENQANAEALRCAVQCARYDNICTDRCDDTHDISVRYCWIKSGLCRAVVQSQGDVKDFNEHK